MKFKINDIVRRKDGCVDSWWISQCKSRQFNPRGRFNIIEVDNDHLKLENMQRESYDPEKFLIDPNFEILEDGTIKEVL